MHSLLGRVQDIYNRLCNIPAGDSLIAIKEEFASIANEVKHAVEDQQLTASDLRTVYPYIHHIQILSRAALHNEAIYSRTNEAMTADLARILDDGAAIKVIPPQPGKQPGAGDLNYDIWRQWYSDHIAHPYYDSRERDWLLKQIPGMTAQKMQTWFVNVRRRSGWSELYRRFADNKRENMEAIFDACDDPDVAIQNKVAPEARKLVVKIRQYLTLESKKTQIEPWLSELLDNYKNKASLKKEPSTASVAAESAEDDVKPGPIKASSKPPRGRTQKRKASDEKTNNTPSKRAKPSLYTTPQHPTSTSSPATSDHAASTTKATPLATVSSSPSHSKSSSPNLQTSSPSASVQEDNKASASSPGEQYDIPPFAAWTSPTQPQKQQQASAFVQPAFVHAQAQHMSMYPSLSSPRMGQTFTANNSITYNIAPPSLYAYAQPAQATVGLPAQPWNQPQWSYAPVQAASYQISPTMTSYPSSSFAMLSSLSSTHPGKRKYVPEDDEMPLTPTGSFERGKTSLSYASYGDQSIADCYIGSNFADSAHQGVSIEPFIYNGNHGFNPEVYSYTA
ncbi:hypothetical protein P389DRAFT_209472 [Cystobasidium minutum MCA 4210]|uniref:uncharacterized protein n=1 Tax=Cystobasidium minutum MCA 4210 TaxID=1397322 RepID=UPI0034CF6D2F|eukprot:jgi/Rhomi1/209472/estExt_Genemark1.C_3_t10070